jgi:predicted DNA-binding antitoxin AbrB/MazE fold protein
VANASAAAFAEVHLSTRTVSALVRGQLLRDGADVRHVQQVLGHRRLDTAFYPRFPRQSSSRSSMGATRERATLESTKRKAMTIKAIYEDAVFKPRERVALADRTEVELDFRPYVPEEDEDTDNPMSFIGLIQNVPKGVPIARDHDKYLP